MNSRPHHSEQLTSLTRACGPTLRRLGQHLLGSASWPTQSELTAVCALPWQFVSYPGPWQPPVWMRRQDSIPSSRTSLETRSDLPRVRAVSARVARRTHQRPALLMDPPSVTRRLLLRHLIARGKP